MDAGDCAPQMRGPFALDDADAYRRWRDWKLEVAARAAQDLVVEVRDPRALRPAEREAIVERCRRTNMAVYASPLRGPDKDIPRMLGSQLGLTRQGARSRPGARQRRSRDRQQDQRRQGRQKGEQRHPGTLRLLIPQT